MASLSDSIAQLVVSEAGRNVPSKPEMAVYGTAGLLYAGFVMMLGAYAAQRALSAVFE